MALVPVNQLAKFYGCKAVIYSAPGMGKTPLLETLDNVVCLFAEQGLMSVRNSTQTTWVSDGRAKRTAPGSTHPKKDEFLTYEEVGEFFKWLEKSAEARKFKCCFIDSVTEICEIVLRHHSKTTKHGQQAYGKMADEMKGYFHLLNNIQGLDVVLIAKETHEQKGTEKVAVGGEMVEQPVYQSRPYFPGKVLPIEVPHLFDMFLYMCRHNPNGRGEVTAFRTKSSNLVFARDRSGLMPEYVPANLGQIFAQISANFNNKR